MKKIFYSILFLLAISGELAQAYSAKDKVRNIRVASDYVMSFNGTASLSAVTAAIPPFGSTFTISGWIKPGISSSGIRTIASWATSSSGNVGNFFRLEGDNYLYYGQWNGTFKKLKSKQQLINGLWHHVAMVKDNNIVHFYINGVESTGDYTSGTSPMDNNTTGDSFRFGGMYQSNTFKEGFNGELDNLTFYSTARSATQIANEFNSGVSLTEAGIWGSWSFDDQASPATDNTGNSRSLTINSAVYSIGNKDVTPTVGTLATGYVNNTTARGYITSATGGNLYWAVYPASVEAATVTAESIKSGKNAIKFGNLTYMTPNRMDFWTMNGFSSATDYSLYAVIESSGKTSSIATTSFTTTNKTLDLGTQIEAVRALMKRMLPTRADEFEYAAIPKIDDTRDVFELSGDGGKILVKGSSATAITAGIRYYMNTYCNASFSWNGDQNTLPTPLPVPAQSVRKETPYAFRYALNYCTINYTMSFWDWNRWEREIDLMATQGVNVFLSPIGTEAVWQKVLEKYGYSFSEIQQFIPGPAYTAWWLMGNLQGEGGPVSQEYINAQVSLQKKIIARAKELGMEVVLQGFAGYVPSNIASKVPGVTVHPQGGWCGYERPPVISGPKAIEMAKTWYEESAKLFGVANFYGGDLFHEGGIVPANLDVTKYAGDIQAEMLKVNPQAVWVLQAWQENPKDVVLNGLKKDQCLILDYANDKGDTWKNRSGFNGIPWVYGVINNFGGRMGIYGRLARLANGLYTMRNDPVKGNNWGIGIAPEAIIFNQVSYDLLWDMVWETSKINPQTWLEKFSGYRYGKNLDNTEQAWKILEPTALACNTSQDGGSESVINARPALDITNVSSWSTSNIYYDPAKLIPAWTNMINSIDVFKDKTTFRYDLVDITRQAMTNFAYTLQKEMTAAFKAGNKTLFTEKSKLFLELIADQDSLLRTRSEFLLGSWISDARAMGTTAAEKNLFERNARALITTWDMSKDGSLHEYSHREWAGLTKYYYLERWKLFISDLAGRLNGQAAKNYNFFSVFEKPWQTNYTQTYLVKPEGDEIELSKYMYAKYMPLINYSLTNKSPEVISTQFSINENSPVGTEVGFVNATDPNPSQILTYAIYSQSVEGAFAIDGSTGKIVVANATVLNSALNPSLKLIVKVKDNGSPAYTLYREISVAVNKPNALNRNGNASQVEIYPNPAMNRINIKLPFEQKTSVKLIDSKGLVCSQICTTDSRFNINVSNYPDGMYLLHIKNATMDATEKVLLQK